jgi:hypothetical protein
MNAIVCGIYIPLPFKKDLNLISFYWLSEIENG